MGIESSFYKDAQENDSSTRETEYQRKKKEQNRKDAMELYKLTNEIKMKKSKNSFEMSDTEWLAKNEAKEVNEIKFNDKEKKVLDQAKGVVAAQSAEEIAKENFMAPLPEKSNNEEYNPETGVGLAVPEFVLENEDELTEEEKEQVGDKFLEFVPQIDDIDEKAESKKAEQEILDMQKKELERVLNESEEGVKVADVVEAYEDIESKEARLKSDKNVYSPAPALEEKEGIYKESKPEKIVTPEQTNKEKSQLELSPNKDVNLTPEQIKAINQNIDVKLTPEQLKAAKEMLEKANEKKEKVKNIINDDLPKSENKLKENHGEGFVNKCKEFFRISWSRDKYQIKNMAKIIGGSLLMAASPYGTFAAPFIFGAGLKYATEGSVGALGWMASKERGELNKAYRNLYNINKLANSKNPKEIENIATGNIESSRIEAQKQLDVAKEKAGLKQNTIDKWGKRIALVAGIVPLFTGIPMDIDLDKTTHMVKIGKEGLKFVVNNTDKMLSLPTTQLLRYAGEMGAYALPFLAGLTPTKLNLSGKKKLDNYSNNYQKIDKQLGKIKSREQSFDSNQVNKAKVILEKNNKPNVDFGGDNINAEVKASDKPKEEIKKVEKVESNEKKWIKVGDLRIDDFVANVEFAKKQSEAKDKINIIRKGFEDDIKKQLNIWKKEIRSMKKLSAEEKVNFINFRDNIKLALNFTGMEMGDDNVKEFLAVKDDGFEKYEKDILGSEAEQLIRKDTLSDKIAKEQKTK